MLGKRFLAFALSACLTVMPVLSASASNVLPSGAISQDTSEDAGSQGGQTYSIMPMSVTNTEQGYQNDFSSEADFTGFVTPGKSMLGNDGNGTYTLKDRDGEGGKNMEAAFSGNGDRGLRLDLKSGIIKEATVQFDWMPVTVNANSNGGQVLFTAPGYWHSYFTLRFDAEGKLYYYTENPLGNAATKQQAFEGSIAQGSAVDTGLKGLNEWFTVTVHFNYVSHSADLTIEALDSEQESYTETDIPIETEANGLEYFTLHMSRKGDGAAATMGLDELSANYTPFGASDILSIVQPEDKKVTKDEYADFDWPATVKATMGDNSTKDVSLGEWTASPEFDEANPKEGVYTWTAPLNLDADGLENPFGLKATFQMNYITEVSQHDYQNDFSFQSDVDKIVNDKSKTLTGNDGSPNVQELADNDGDGYARVRWVDPGGSRVSKLDINSGIIKGATVNFDLMLKEHSFNNLGGFRVMFLSPDSKHSYFTLRYDSDNLLYYYTEDTLGVESQQSFEGSISIGNEKATGMGGLDKWVTVTVDFDYTSHTANLKIKEKNGTGSFEVTGIPIEAEANGVGTFLLCLVRDGNTPTAEIGLDNVTADYIPLAETDIASIKKIEDVYLTPDTYKGFVFPTEVEATLRNGGSAKIPLGKWTSDPEFVYETATTGSYVWTASLDVPEEYGNPLGLKATFKMDYMVEVSSHDYDNNFSFDSNVKEFVEWSKSMNSTSGTGTMTLSRETEDGNSYLHATGVNQGGSRGNRVDLNPRIIRNATVEFDWRPIEVSGGGVGTLMFVAPDCWHPYLTLQVDAKNKISVYTEDSLNDSATKQTAFDGMITADEPLSTGMGEAKKWFHVKLDFDYFEHTAVLTLTEKDNEENTFTKEIPIEPEALGIRSFAIVLQRQTGNTTFTTDIDNLTADYVRFTDQDIITIEQPSDVNVAKDAFDREDTSVFPKEVKATLGDYSTTTIKLGKWEADPAFVLDSATEGDYTWAAPLDTELNNPLELVAKFQMFYTIYPFPLYVHNPTTLELEYGQTWNGTFPKTATAFMSNSATMEMPIDQTTWTAIRAFDGSKEGIYVYGANIKGEEGKSTVVREQLIPNENHETHQTEGYDFDVFYRISYFKTNDNFNGNERYMENLDRGVYAIKTDKGVFVSWRILVDEYGDDVVFEVYRNGEKIADVKNLTNYLDNAGNVGDKYSVTLIKDGHEDPSEEFTAINQNYLSIPMQKPDAQPSKTEEKAEYTLNDAGVADVDGDGQYEIIVKWYPTNAFDSGNAVKPSSPTIFDVYKMDGTPLWRLNLGLEMPSGAHFNQFIFYDLDQDGKAELFIKTSDGSITYRPTDDGKFVMTEEYEVSYIGDRSVKPGSNVNDNGHVSANSNEYVTVFNGATGEEIQTIDYINKTGNYTDWGLAGGGKDDGGNRSARYNMAVAYLPYEKGSDKTIPAVLFNRGYYNKTTVAAYTLRDGEIKLEWNFVTENDTDYAGKGNHNIATGDLDNDGFDELVIGAMALDHDGSVLWVKDGENGQDHQGHADSIHLSAMFPDSTQLYVMTPSEETESTMNYMVSNAGTGARIMGLFFTTQKDFGRGVAANITPTPGFEFWATNSGLQYQGGIFNLTKGVLQTQKPATVSTNWRLYWDGDLLSELGDGVDTGKGNDAMAIYKYDWQNNELNNIYTFANTHTNNDTKNNPSLTADLFGDWREEVMLPSADNNELRIYMTTYETDYMIYTLMHDPVYRNAVANQNTSYNQPPALSYYLGEDVKDKVLNLELPTYNIKYTPRSDVKYTVIVDEEEVKKELDKVFDGKYSEAIVKATGVNSGDKLMDYMKKQVIAKAANTSLGEIPETQTMVTFIKLSIVFPAEEGGRDRVVEIDESNYEDYKEYFSKNGLDVRIDYPEGTNGTDYNFVIHHMFTLGDNAGDTESFASVATKDFGEIKKTENGLVIHITNASPFSIAWQKIQEGIRGDDDEPDLVETLDSTVPKTGDHMDTMIMVWLAVLVFAVAGASVMIVRKRRGSNAEK